jgi:hypothetical protein
VVRLPTEERLFGRRKEGNIYKVYQPPSHMSMAYISMKENLRP